MRALALFLPLALSRAVAVDHCKLDPWFRAARADPVASSDAPGIAADAIQEAQFSQGSVKCTLGFKPYGQPTRLLHSSSRINSYLLIAACRLPVVPPRAHVGTAMAADAADHTPVKIATSRRCATHRD